MGTACSNNQGRAIDCGLPYTSAAVRALDIAVDGLLQQLYRHGRLLDNVEKNYVDGHFFLEEQILLYVELRYPQIIPIA